MGTTAPPKQARSNLHGKMISQSYSVRPIGYRPEDTRESIGGSGITMMKFWGPTGLSNYGRVKKQATSTYQHCRSRATSHGWSISVLPRRSSRAHQTPGKLRLQGGFYGPLRSWDCHSGAPRSTYPCHGGIGRIFITLPSGTTDIPR